MGCLQPFVPAKPSLSLKRPQGGRFCPGQSSRICKLLHTLSNVGQAHQMHKISSILDLSWQLVPMMLYAAKTDLSQPHTHLTACPASVQEPPLCHAKHSYFQFHHKYFVTMEHCNAVQDKIEHLACNACTCLVAEAEQQHAVVTLCGENTKEISRPVSL